MPLAGLICNNAACSASTVMGQGPFQTVKPVCKVNIFKEARWAVQFGLKGVAQGLWRVVGFLQPPCVQPLQLGWHPLVVEGAVGLGSLAS